MQITNRLIREFPKISELRKILYFEDVRVIKRDAFNSLFVICEDREGNGYTIKDATLYIVKPGQEKETVTIARIKSLLSTMCYHANERKEFVELVKEFVLVDGKINDQHVEKLIDEGLLIVKDYTLDLEQNGFCNAPLTLTITGPFPTYSLRYHKGVFDGEIFSIDGGV